MRHPRSASAARTIVVALAIATAAPALAAEPPNATAAKPVKAADPDKPICKTEDVTGSLVPKRVCRTQKQIDAERQASEDLNKERLELGGESHEGLSLTPSGAQSHP